MAAMVFPLRAPPLPASTRISCMPHLHRCLQTLNQSKLLAVGEEEGYISIIDTQAQQALPSLLYGDEEAKPRAWWRAHANSVYSLAWAKVSCMQGRGGVGGSSAAAATTVAMLEACEALLCCWASRAMTCRHAVRGAAAAAVHAAAQHLTLYPNCTNPVF